VEGFSTPAKRSDRVILEANTEYWDRERFPAPAVLIKELLDQGFKTVAIVDPGKSP